MLSDEVLVMLVFVLIGYIVIFVAGAVWMIEMYRRRKNDEMMALCVKPIVYAMEVGARYYFEWLTANRVPSMSTYDMGDDMIPKKTQKKCKCGGHGSNMGDDYWKPQKKDTIIEDTMLNPDETGKKKEQMGNPDITL